MTIEHARLREHLERGIATPVAPWKRWGPYVSERAWGTVREDYSPDGAAWDYFPHDQARSRAYRWGEDGLAAVCDRYQLLVLAMAFWNGKDPILKERLFGLVPSEANHGEDVKEYYFYLDSTPTHSYMKWLYKYPQEQYPYAKLIDENRARRGRPAGEYELLDTGLFDENRYFDIFVEYAKNDPEDLCVRVEIFNRGPEDAPIHVLPQLWFRNTWAWGANPKPEPVIQLSKPFSRAPKGSAKPEKHLTLSASDEGAESLDNLPFPYRLGTRYLYGDAGGKPLFTNNETHCEKVWGPHVKSRTPYVKDAFHRHVIDGDASAVNPEQRGTKACLHYGPINVPAGESVVLRLRLSDQKLDNPLADVDRIVALRRKDADAFYDTVHPPKASEDERRVQRQALAGMLWSKQVYFYDADQWFNGDNPASPPPASRKRGRNRHWMHLNSMRVLSMPDKWEYPWFAAWDLAFHCVPLTLVDPEFAKQQLWLLMFEQFQHPSGQIPAYEWEFSDLNPPVQAWAVWRVYNMDRVRNGVGDRRWLEQCFHKLLLNFTWWVNKVDREGNNVFEGGFLGLDNITVLDRSHELPHGARLEQSDATGWMGAFCLSLMRIALELAHENRAYESLATKFFQHYVYVGAAMTHMGGRDYQLWDADDKFFYDVLRYADGTFHKFRVRSLVGLIPLYAVERLEEDWLEGFNEFRSNLNWFLKHRQDLAKRCVVTIERNGKRVHVLTIVDQSQVRHLMERIWDPQEFRSDHGLRSLSKVHGAQPFRFEAAQVGYEPAESVEMLKGGNSNWRGPIWFPTAFMLMESLRKLGKAYGADAQINSPVAGEAPITCSGMARGFADRMIALFTRDKSGKRPVHGAYKKFQEDPHWRDLILFYEYFHGDTGMGLGASHQTGWTGLVASMIDEHRR
ncbi:MAG: Mannosyl oligosaccharide glucosidase [Phycisphaerales bacterium]|nr:Mannosyl oligosaccharide glucosidase [Phycisphaerales bacterium]